MKSHSDSLLDIATGVLEDVRLAYPGMQGLDRDLTRLTLLVKDRGLGVFTLDLPARDSALVAGLESGKLSTVGTQQYSKRCKVPRLFAGLYKLIFDENAFLRPDADPTAVAFLRQVLCLGKKTAVPCSRKRELTAIKDYVDVEREIRPPSLGWGMDNLGVDSVIRSVHFCDTVDRALPLFPSPIGDGEWRTLNTLLSNCQQIADVVAESLGTLCIDCVIDESLRGTGVSGLGHGPGAVAERGGRYFDKYRFTNWSPKLSNTFPFERTGKMPNDEDLIVLPHEVPARLISVPKTAKGPRLIAAEPSEQMYCQKLTGSWLRRRVKETFIGSFIDFRRQELSGDLVLKASLDQTLATIDLSSASDRLSCWVVERIFRRNPSVLRALHAHRTRWIHIPQTGEYLELKKFASQGTDVTFPVQSIAFLVIALAACAKGEITEETLLRLRGRVRVFGDDIIIPSYGYVGINKLMHTLGLKVNENKSFVHGQFRESCGTDAFKGHDVTPCCPKTLIPENPASCKAVIDQTNNLFYKGYWNASKRLENRLHRHTRKRYAMVGRDAGATGLGSYSLNSVLVEFQTENSPRPSEGLRNFVRRQMRLYNSGALRRVLGPIRWNENLHRFEVRCETIRSSSKVRPFDSGYSGLLHRAISPRRTDILDSVSGLSGVPERPSLSNWARWEPITSFMR